MASTSTTEPSSAMKKCPNWLEMPHELMVNIFQRLPTLEILNSTRKVCTTWGTICKYPKMWKVIDLAEPCYDDCRDLCLKTLTKEAVDLSCGELIDISIDGFTTNGLLQHIVLCSSKLKRLRLVDCVRIKVSVLSEAVKRLPQLEELWLYDTDINAESLEYIGRNCPHFKTLKISRGLCLPLKLDDLALAVANYMPDLRHLEMNDKETTNNGLEAILNGCPHLEYLDVSLCYFLDLDEDLRNLCNERIKDFKDNSELKSYLKLRCSGVEVDDSDEDIIIT